MRLFKIGAIMEPTRIATGLDRGQMGERHHRPAALTPAWQRIIQKSCELLSRYELWGIKQLIYYFNAAFIDPADITDDAYDAFARTKRTSLTPAQSRMRIRAALRGWDRLRTEVPELALPAPPRLLVESRFTNPSFALYPSSFQEELAEFCRHARTGGIAHHLLDCKNADGPRSSTRKSSAPLNALSLKTRLQLIRSAAGAQVRAGRTIESITSISHVATADALTIFLTEMRARQDLKAKGDAGCPRQYFTAAKVALDIAALARNWCRLDAAELTAIGHICRNLRWRRSYDRLFRPVRVTTSMRQFENPDAVRRWFELPNQLIASAENARLAGSKISLRVANDVEFAVMSCLLRDSPIRIRTLAALRIAGDRLNITEGDAAFLVIYAADNKNFKPMKTPLSEDAGKVLQLYRAHYRPWILKRFGGDPQNPFLFPGQNGRHRHVATLGASFRRRHKDAGFYFTPHLTRHLLAKLLTEREGASVDAVRSLLGHKSLDTAHRHYVEDRIDLASRHFRSVVGPAALSLRSIITPRDQEFRLTDVLKFYVTAESLHNLESNRHRSRNYVKTTATYFARFQDYVQRSGHGATSIGIATRQHVILDMDTLAFWSMGGSKRGVRVEAARFYSTVKTDLSIDVLCHEPSEVAYLNMGTQWKGAPCCQWTERFIPIDVYSDHGAFDRFWNSDLYRRLRAKRDFESCKACGLTRTFDEVMFHFTPLLKSRLIESKRIAEAEARSIYDDQEVVRACRALSLDLPSLRRTFMRLGLSTDRLRCIETDGIAALPTLDRDCWDAFLKSDAVPEPAIDMTLGGCFTGFGWFEPDCDPGAKVAARWMGGGRVASVYFRVQPRQEYQIRLTAHHLRSAEMAGGLSLMVAGCPLEIEQSTLNKEGITILTAVVSEELATIHGGRIWLSIGYTDNHGHEGWVSFSQLEVTPIAARASWVAATRAAD
jgi:integrase